MLRAPVLAVHLNAIAPPRGIGVSA